MDSPMRWVVVILVVAAIIGLVVLARGGAERGNPTPSPAAAIVVTVT